MILNATTSGNMVHHNALSVLSTDSSARVHAFIVGASSIKRAIGILHAFWSTTLIRITTIFAYAAAHAIST